MNLATIPFGVPFLETLARRFLAENEAPLSPGLILLPTRRAARALAEAFLRVGEGRPMLLPRMVAIGAADEAGLALMPGGAGALDLPPAIAPLRRLAELARLIMAAPESAGGARTLEHAWGLAADLAALMDEAERAEVALEQALAVAVDGSEAEHWQQTVTFLGIVTRVWPEFLAEQGLMNPAARQAALLKAQARAWEERPPAEPVWLAGITAARPSIVEVARVVARQERGAVVLPGLATSMDKDAWDAIGQAHPQAGMRELLGALGAARGDVAVWEGAASCKPGRVALLESALLPAAATGAYLAPVEAPEGLVRLDAADEQAEAVAIAMVLREALEVPGRRAALVTPDRALAARVSAELLRWGVVADDSAGENLAETPPGVFLRLLARLAAEWRPVNLLAVLKHPLASFGLDPGACRDLARQWEMEVLRGPAPPATIAGLRMATEKRASQAGLELLGRLEAAMAPLLRVAGGVAGPATLVAGPAAQLAALVEAAEAAAATGETDGAERLWALEEGEALASLLAEAMEAVGAMKPQPIASLAPLLEALLEGNVVRSRRPLRAGAAGEHPRVAIWGLVEARLQAAELMVLGGLVEGVWPQAADPGPWLSRRMRARAGLPDAEESIGQAAHDFVAASCAAPEVVLSVPHRRGRAPTVPARWLTRIGARIGGRIGARIGAPTGLSAHPAAAWAGRVDQPLKVVPARPPEPRPPVARRPRKLSVTEIETWLNDPYAIYARHVLGLKPLDPLEQDTDAADFGELVHRALADFLVKAGDAWPADAARGLAQRLVLETVGLRPALAAWWRPRLVRIAEFVAEAEAARRAEAAGRADPALAVKTELSGKWELAVENGFELRGRADRVEVRAGGVAILDYKTGRPPSQKEVAAGRAPQLLLEAAMAAAGAFPGLAPMPARELVYWRLSGREPAGEVTTLFEGDAAGLAAAIEGAQAGLVGLVRAFDDPGMPYRAQPHAAWRPRYPQYAQLARLAEWDGGEDDDEPS
jgi:ATP-dependent helicase/nuclease subunit B